MKRTNSWNKVNNRSININKFENKQTYSKETEHKNKVNTKFIMNKGNWILTKSISMNKMTEMCDIKIVQKGNANKKQQMNTNELKYANKTKTKQKQKQKQKHEERNRRIEWINNDKYK